MMIMITTTTTTFFSLIADHNKAALSLAWAVARQRETKETV